MKKNPYPENYVIAKFRVRETGEYKNFKIDEKVINDEFKILTAQRSWYKGTSINERQAAAIKRRFKLNELSLGRQFEILFECKCNINTKEA